MSPAPMPLHRAKLCLSSSLALIAACSSDGLPSGRTPPGGLDLDAPFLADMAARDGFPQPDSLVPSVDGAAHPDASSTGDGGGGFCGGTRVAGTCVDRFFGPAWKCLAPGGPCRRHKHAQAPLTTYFCWSNGANIEFFNGLAFWLNFGRQCLGAKPEPRPGGDSLYFGDGYLTYNYSTGDVICPNGSKINIGPDFGGCTNLRSLLLGPDLATCPEDPPSDRACN